MAKHVTKGLFFKKGKAHIKRKGKLRYTSFESAREYAYKNGVSNQELEAALEAESSPHFFDSLWNGDS